MKILYIANVRLPTEKAHGLQIMKTCEAFAKAGNELELAVPTRRNILHEDAFAYYRARPVFRLTSVAVPDFISFGKIGFLISLLLFSERVRFLKSFWSADIVYSRDALVLLQYVFLGRHFVFEAHAKPSFFTRIVAQRAYRVVVISRALEAAYKAVGVLHEKIVVAPDAVDACLFDEVPSRAQARATLGLASDAKIVVYTGHLYARKGADTLAQAAALIPEVQFVFVGGTTSDIASFRSQWAQQENIHIIGHVLHTRALQYMRSADVLVIPNSGKDQDSREFTSPMKLFEYMASGTPIVASDVPAIREVLGEQDATFFTPDDAAALVAIITLVLSHDRAAQEKAQSAQKKAGEYTWEKRAKIISNFITSI